MVGSALLDHLLRIGDLGPEDRAAVLGVQGEVRTFRRHEDLSKAGSVPTNAVVVLDGFLQRYASRRDGSRQIHSFYIPGDAPSLESIHVDYLDSNLCAAIPSRVAMIPYVEIYPLMTRRPKVQEYIWRSGVIQSAVYREWLTRNSQMSADVAMAHLFCEIYKRFSAANLVQHNSCEMPLTQEMLADALGLTGVHVNRVLQQLRETGMVDHRAGRLFMHDFNRLTSFADFDPSYLHLKNGRARSHI